MSSKALLSVLVLVVACAGAIAASGNSQGPHPESISIVSFGTMVGVDGPFLLEENSIRGVRGDELPWEVESARGRLDTDGHLTIQVRGLVFKDAPFVPFKLRGTNDEVELRGLVSCLTEAGANRTGVVNVLTAGFPATLAGNASIVATVQLPNPCIHPIIMVVAGRQEKWLAVSGAGSKKLVGDASDEEPPDRDAPRPSSGLVKP